MTGGRPWPYEVREASQEDKWSINFAAAPFKKDLDCGGKDSGNTACWSAAVNITVPIACCVVFIIVLAILYVTSPKPNELPDNYINSRSSLHTRSTSTTTNMPRKVETSYQNTGLSTDTLTAPTDAFRPTPPLDSISIRVQQDPSLCTQL